MIRAVIFDLDHTLFDRHATLMTIAAEFRKAFNVKSGVTDEEIGEKWIYADDHFIYFGWEYVFSYLIENGIFEVPPQFGEYSSFLYRHFAKVAVPFPETIPMLKALRKNGYKLGLITNGGHMLQYKKLEMLSLTDKFDEIIISGDVMADKPDRDIFFIMCEKFSLSPDELVYVGDNPVNDIEGARNAGFKTIWMNTTGFWQEEIPPADLSVTEVSQILSAVKKLDGKNTEGA